MLCWYCLTKCLCGLCHGAVRWYVAGDPSSPVEPRIIVNTDTESMDFVEPSFNVRRPADRYSENKLATDDDDDGDDWSTSMNVDESRPVIPTPLSVSRPSTDGQTTVRLGPDWIVSYSGQLDNEATFLAGLVIVLIYFHSI